ncbi:tyrosine-type recombinase/integrase [Rhodocista pekingensis]|uniref:Tyrosine-type recombinase/integrase n=1 Tax=Rhodocista pekingensis TaxID=201185 RepID=A0ABW2L0H1_9PROT
MPRLTKRTVDGAVPRNTDYFLWDEEIPGFGLRVLRTGIKSYVIQYRAGGRTRRYSFSHHGVMTPEEARRTARELLVAVHRGENPSEEARLQRLAPTMAALCDRFMDEHVRQRCKPSTQGEYRRAVELFIKPEIGAHKVLDVTRADIARLHHKARDIPYQANRTLGVLSKLFNLAEVWGLRPDGSNPCRHVRKYPEQKRERFLSAEELGRLAAALDAAEADGSESVHVIAAIRLLILTGCRLGEIQTLKWEHVHPGHLALPDSKTGAKKVYLGEAAMAVLAAVPRLPGNPYVICGAVDGQHLKEIQRPWRRLRMRAGLPDLRIHDLRHSFASAAVGMGESLPMIGKLLGHTQVQTTARYAHLADDPLRASSERVSAALAARMKGQAAG